MRAAALRRRRGGAGDGNESDHGAMSRLGWIAGCSLLAALALAACSTGDTVSLDPVANAATETAKVSSVRIDMTITTRSPDLPQGVTTTASGIMDNRAKRGRMTMDMSELAGATNGAVGGPEAWRGEQVIDFSNGRLVTYMRIPAMTRELHTAKPWIKLDFQKLGRQMGIDFQQFMQLGQGNPAQAVDYLRAASGKVEKKGREKVRGVDTTHYHTTIDFEKYPDLVAPSKRAAMRKTVPADVWIGDDQIVRRMKFNYEMRVLDANTGERRPTEMDMTMELYDFGAAVEIQLPPAGQVLDLMKLIEQAQ